MDALVKKLQEWINTNRELITENPQLLIKMKEKLAKRYGDDDDSYDDSDSDGNSDGEDDINVREDDDDIKELGFNDDHQNYDSEDEDGFSDDEDLKGLTVKDSLEDDDGDDAAKWLANNDPSKKQKRQAPVAQSEPDESDEDAISDDASFSAPPVKQAKPQAKPEGQTDTSDEKYVNEKEAKVGGGRWKPNTANYKPEHHERIKGHMDQGYSHREAERMAGAHAGANDLNTAYHSSHDIEEPSGAFLNSLRPKAETFIGNWNKMRLRDADASKNPELYHTNKIHESVKEHRKDYDQAWKDHQNSDEYKNMDMFDQMDAQSSFKKKWHAENPDHAEAFKNLGTKEHKKEAGEKYEQSFQDQLEHLLTAHASGDGAMDSKSVGQHMGGSKNEDGGYDSNKVRDPMASFAAENPKMKEFAMQRLLNTERYQKHMTPDQMDRMKRVAGAKAGTAAPEAASTPEVAPTPAVPKTIVRKPGGENV